MPLCPVQSRVCASRYSKRDFPSAPSRPSRTTLRSAASIEPLSPRGTLPRVDSDESAWSCRTISHIRLASVAVRDIEAAIAFYVNALGFELRADERFGPEFRWVEVAPNRANGVVFNELPTQQPRGVKQALVQDPDGNGFVLVDRQ